MNPRVLYFTAIENCTAILRVRFELNTRLDFVARLLFTLPGETHVSRAARNLFRCSCLREDILFCQVSSPLLTGRDLHVIVHRCSRNRCAARCSLPVCPTLFCPFAQQPLDFMPRMFLVMFLQPLFLFYPNRGDQMRKARQTDLGEREGHLFQVLRRGPETSDARTLTSSCWSSRSNNHD